MEDRNTIAGSFIRYRLPPLVLLFVGGLITVLLFQYIRETHRSTILAEIKNRAALYKDLIRDKLDRNFEIFDSIRDFHDVQENIPPREFNQFVHKLVQNHPEITDILWIPKLSRPDVQYLQNHTDGNLLSAVKETKSKGEVWPIYHNEGSSNSFQNIQWRDNNVQRFPKLIEAARRSMKRNQPVFTPVFPLDQPKGASAMFVVQHIKQNIILHRSPERTIKTNGGFIAQLLNLSSLIRTALDKFDPEALQFYVFDEEGQYIASYGQPDSNVSRNPLHSVKQTYNRKPAYDRKMVVRGNKYNLLAYPGKRDPASVPRDALATLVAGFLITGLAGFYLQTMLNQARESERQARTDPLTGLFNRRTFFRRLEEELNRVERYSRPLSLIMIDIDHFKEVNDRHGHQAGDQVLEHLATLIEEQTRDVDLPARYGGEEFCVLLPETDGSAACEIGERIRSTFEQSQLQVHGKQLTQVTCSVGVATCDGDPCNLDEFIEQADRALYKAKQQGRNQVVSLN